MLFWKIVKIVATRCQILWLKFTKFDFGWDFDPDPAGGAYSAPPDPLAGFKGPTSKGRRGEGRRGKGREVRVGEGRGGEGRSSCLPPRFDNPGYGPEFGENPTPIPYPTNLALFGHKITLYRFNQGLILLQGGSNLSRGLSPWPPHFNHCAAAAAASAASLQSNARSTKLSGLLIAPCDIVASYVYSRVHRSRGVGLWLVLINIFAVIGTSSNMRCS